MITRLEAIRYRCFERLGINLGQFQIVVGANGAGKSTLLDIPVLLGELLKADHLATVFTVQRGENPPRAGNPQDLIFAGRGNDFSLALEAQLPEIVREKLAGSLVARATHAKQKSKAGRLLALIDAAWPTHIRYELRLEVFNEREINVKNEYLYVFPEKYAPDRASGGLHGEQHRGQAHWHFILLREYDGLVEFTTEADPIQGSATKKETIRIKSNLLALSAMKYRPDVYPAASWLYEHLTEQTIFLDPNWNLMRCASPPGQPKTLIPSGRNIPWLALDLKQQDAPEDARADYRSENYADWVAHVKTALPQITDIDIRVREDDHHAYFIVTYLGGYKVPLSGLSDGTLRILTLTLLPSLRRPPSILMTEEPEDGIHPRAIEAVLQSLSSLYDSQVLISSHSPVVLAKSRLDQILCARQEKNRGVILVAGIDHPRLQEWRGEIDLGSLFAAGVLG
ncbi:ATPase_AAA_core domain-containing protein [Gammaproteobacteria bacterium]